MVIEHIRGKLAHKGGDYVVVDVGGMGYRVLVPQSTMDALPAPGEPVELLTYLQVREDALNLYGFITDAERQVFLALIGVSGVGPRLGLAALSVLSPGQAFQAIAQGDVATLTSVPGIGKKTAERIILELRSTAEKVTVSMPGMVQPRPVEADALEALAALGYTRRQAEGAVARACAELGEKAKLDEVVRRALRYVS